MKLISQILAISLLLIFSSCGQKHENEEASAETQSEASHSTKNANELSLDNGKLWQANPETTEGVNNMIQIMDSFSDTENVEAYHTAQAALESEFTMIFKKCTMTGEAHNQLHNFLIPIKSSFKGLSSDDLNECKMAYEELNQHLKIYKDFFV